jgi:hypothetical protein
MNEKQDNQDEDSQFDREVKILEGYLKDGVITQSKFDKDMSDLIREHNED